jgi:hypothetical protein
MLNDPRASVGTRMARSRRLTSALNQARAHAVNDRIRLFLARYNADYVSARTTRSANGGDRGGFIGELPQVTPMQ